MPNDFTRSVDKNISTIDRGTARLRRSGRSVIASAKKNIFEFPVFVSNSVPLDYATATTSLLEQVYASYLQMAISANPVVDGRALSSGNPFSNLKSNVNKYLEYTDTTYQHDACHNVITNDDGVVLEFSMIDVSDNDAEIITEYVNHEPLSEFEHFFTEAKSVKDTIKDLEKANRDKDKAIDKVKRDAQAEINRNNNKNRVDIQKAEREAERAKKDLERSNEKINNLQDRYDKLQKQYDDATSSDKSAADQRAIERHKKDMEKIQLEIERAKREAKDYDKKVEKLELEIAEAKENAKEKAINLKNQRADLANRARVKAPTMLKDQDVQKLNTMKPLLMNVDLNAVDVNGSISPVSYVLGVKCNTRLVKSEMIPEVAQYPLKEMNTIARKAKWKAGELKFFSDIVFRIKQKKQTAVDSRDPNRKWFRRLYELAHMKGDSRVEANLNGESFFKQFLSAKMGHNTPNSGLIPNATIIVSKADVDATKMLTEIDLLKGSTAKKICNELFLVAFVVIDTDAESIKMMIPDLHNDYEIHSIASVNRQLAALDIAGTKANEKFKLL